MSVNHTHICTTCDVAQEHGDGFCDDCGTQLVAIRYCDDCGVKALHAGKFCRECGAKLPIAPAVSPPPSQTTTTVAPAKPAQPAWLSKPDPAPAAKPVQKPKPISKPPQVVKPVDVAPINAPIKNNTAAPLALRPMAAPVAMRPAPLAPATSTVNTTTALMASAAGVLAIGALMANVIPLAHAAYALFVMMLILGGMRLRHTAANGVDSLIDWVWEDPVLRKRILGE